jgi:hypothetical protein
MGNPHGVRARRLLPSAGDPDVSVAVPAMIARNPDIFATGASRTLFDHRMRWRNRYEDFLSAGGKRQPDGKKECSTESTHAFMVACYACDRKSERRQQLEWRNWQTHGTQNPATFTGHVGSTPTSSTILGIESKGFIDRICSRVLDVP